MAVLYTKLFNLLESRGLSSTYWLVNHGIYYKTLERLKKNSPVSTKTIGVLCELLDCQPGDIMEYIKDEDVQYEPSNR